MLWLVTWTSRATVLAVGFFWLLVLFVNTVGAADQPVPAEQTSARSNALLPAEHVRPAWAAHAVGRTHKPPLGLPALSWPQENPPQALRVSLGRKLFFDRRLSLNGTMSCAMCHVPEQGFTNNELSVAVGLNGLSARRNAPSLLNVAYYQALFQDGRDPALETQFFSPLLAPNEMANPSVGHVIAKIRQLPDYKSRFESVFGRPASPDRIGMALAAYQRTLLAARSRFDQWRFGGRTEAITAREQHGFELFTGKAGCQNCHQVQADFALFTDQQPHDTGYGWHREQLRQHPPATIQVELAPGQFVAVSQALIASVGLPQAKDLGRYEVTLDPDDLWRFRTPQLRNVALTAPYMHDGGLPTLRAVLQFYNQGGYPHNGQSPLIRPLNLSPAELMALEAFLRSLTSPDLNQLVVEARIERPDSFRH